MINAHPSIAIPLETHWIPRWYEERTGLTPEGFVTPGLISSLLEYPKFSRLGLTRGDLEPLIKSSEPVPYSAFVTGVFNLYGKAQGKPLVGDKTTSYVRSIRTLHSLWPKARFIHLIRDGRDVCLSVINWNDKAESLARWFPTWTQDPVSTAAVWWKRNVQLGREAGQQLGPELYYEMRYESLVANPLKECEELCRFLALPHDMSMLRFHEGRTKSEPGLSAKKAWLPVTSGLRDWRDQMPAEDLERFEALAGDLLEELGFPRGISRPEKKVPKPASVIEEIFTQDARSRSGRPLPKDS